jgi:anti-sigma B factor antagonist
MELEGRIALGRESQYIEREVADLIKAGHKKIVIDLSKVSYMDSTGIGIIAYSAGQVRSAGGQVRIAGAGGIVLESLKISGLDKVIGFGADVSAACQAFAKA